MARDLIVHHASEAFSATATPAALNPKTAGVASKCPNCDFHIQNDGSVDLVLQSVTETDDDAGFRIPAGEFKTVPFCDAGDGQWQLNSTDGSTAVTATVAYFGPPA